MSAKFILVLAVCFAFMNVHYVNAATTTTKSTTAKPTNSTAVRFTQTGGVLALVLLPIALHP